MRSDRPAGGVLETILEEGIEHHYNLAYGDCRAALREIAERLSLPLLELARGSGISGVWSDEHIGFHDAIVPSAVYLRETERLEVSVVGISTAGRHPGLIAVELASPAEACPR